MTIYIEKLSFLINSIAFFRFFKRLPKLLPKLRKLILNIYILTDIDLMT